MDWWFWFSLLAGTILSVIAGTIIFWLGAFVIAKYYFGKHTNFVDLDDLLAQPKGRQRLKDLLDDYNKRYPDAE